MCKFASLFFIHQLHLMLLFSLTCFATAGDHSPVQNPSNPNQKHSDASRNASVLPATSTSSVPAQAAGLVNAPHDDNWSADLAADLERAPERAPKRSSEHHPEQDPEVLASYLASSILDANLVNERQTNFSNEHSLHSAASEADMRTNLDHLLELNNNNQPIYTDQYVVQLNGGPELARELSERHGFVYLGQIFDDHYHIRHRRLSKRSLEPAHADYHRTLINEPTVSFVKQQTLKRRVKRDFQPITRPHNYNTKPPSANSRFNDPQWNQMWYLQNKGLDMNVQKVWDMNITGKGIVVTILDDGLEKDHPDIANNYDPNASYDVNNLDPDPQPRYDMLDSNRHGTRCAGEVAAVANNNICGVGIAYDSKIGGVRMLDGDVTDAVEARSLSLNNQHIDIYSASWGPDDDGKTVDGPGELATRAFIEGVTKGRAGLGSIFIWASGNGGREHDNCNCDGYTNAIYTLSISSATENGLVPWYSEACSSTLATTYSSGAYGEKQIITTDLHHRCTNTHTGTSASAPLAAGIAALVLQANPRLTWRDMQHLVVQTANPGNLQASDWRVNGVGKKVSHSFGYGLMDAQAMVQLAKEWITVPSQKICETRSNPINRSIPFKSYVELSLEVHCDKVKYLEHVQAKINLTTNRRGDIHIYLISPAGTRATLVAERAMDNSRAGFVNWPFLTVHSWGEKPDGKWKLEIHNEGKYHNRANLKEWTLIMYGTSENPDRRRKKNTASANGRTGFAGVAVHSTNSAKNEGHRLSGAGRLDNALNEMKPLNRTRINSIVFKPTLSKPNELLNTGDRVLFEAGKNVSGRLQLNNGHQPNTVVSNELGLSIYNPPDNAIDTTHTSNHQLTDQEPFGTNDIDKSTRAEKSGNERSKAIANQSSKEQLSRLGNRLNGLPSGDAPAKSIKSDGRGGNLGDYEHQAAESSTSGLNQNKIAYDCKDNFYFHGLCVKRCPDNFYSYELVANLDALNTPVDNLAKVSANRRRSSTEYHSIDEFNRFRELKEPRKLKEFAEPETDSRSNENRFNENRLNENRSNENRFNENRSNENRLNENRPNENRPNENPSNENRSKENRPNENQSSNHPQTTSSSALNSSDSLGQLNQFSAPIHSNETASSQSGTASQQSNAPSSNALPSTTPSSTTNGAPTTLPPLSSVSSDTIQINSYIPYNSHFSIKQKDLNKLIWLKQQDLAESVASMKNSFYQKLVQESERYEDSLENYQVDLGIEKSDEKLERISICLKCHYTCRNCTGRKSNQCTACYQDAQLDADSGRCLFKDVLSDISKAKSTSSDLWPNVKFDSRVQNWITIFSLLLCLFFSAGFFYLLLCRRAECPHKSFPELQQYNHNKHSLSTTAAEYFQQQSKLCAEPLNGELHESALEPPYELPGSKPSFFISFLRFFGSRSGCNGPKNGKCGQPANAQVKYNSIPLGFEMVRGGPTVDTNETGHEEIT